MAAVSLAGINSWMNSDRLSSTSRHLLLLLKILANYFCIVA